MPENCNHMTKLVNIISLFVILIIVVSSCKSKKVDYITYYNKVNQIDSIYRMANDPILAQKQYRKLFRKYIPKNQDRIQEYETYIILSDKYNRRFGGKKSLYKLIQLIAPYWDYKKDDDEFFKIYKKNNIDKIQIEKEVVKWKKSLSKPLVDSFTLAFTRDQDNDRDDAIKMKLNDEKNAKLLISSFKNYGYPSLQKIGLYGNGNVFMPMGTILVHMPFVKEYKILENKIFEYVKSGDCPPRDYAGMVDRYNLQVSRKEILYGAYIGNSTFDTLAVNRNRKKIGLPSLAHADKIRKDLRKSESSHSR